MPQPTPRSQPAVRRWAALAVALVLVAALAACGSAGQADTGAGAAVGTSTLPAGAAYPVTIEHAFGTTTIEEPPRRVVTIGFTDHDVALALGVVPVGIRQWYGDADYVWPWAEDELGDATPELLGSGDLNIEQIAALEPDLILGMYVGLEPDEYEKLSALAPTVAQSGDHPDFGTPWQEMTLTAGQALGRSAEAEQLVDDVEAQFARVREAHPEFEGVELAYAGAYDGGQFYVETEGSTRVQVLLDLGFVVGDELAALGSDRFYHEISPEQLELLDQDLVVWEPADVSLVPAIRANPLYGTLAVSQEDRAVFLDDPVVAGALAHSTVLSLPFLLDELVPRLDAAVARLDG